MIDLPGLKSVQDRTNLATIQKQVNKAFSLVALDYMQVDDDHRKRLLEELKKVVEYLQGRTDSMIFILNLVDQRGADDLPLEVKINKLREEIKDVLSLSELPDVLPFNARLLYYAQCAWGSGAFNEPSIVDQQTRLKFIQAMFQECAGVIKLNTKENRDLKNWFRDIEDEIEDNKPIDDETMRQILRYSLEWSGGKELWEIFRIRVEKSFTELVIIPALVEVFNNYDVLLVYLNNFANIRKIEWKEEIEQEKNKVSRIRHNLHNYSKNKTEEFKNDITRWIGELKSNDQNKDSRLRQEASKKGLKSFDEVFDTVQDIEKDLALVLIVPVIDALKNNQSAYKLEDKLSEVISPPLARHIAQVYDELSRRFGKFEKQSEFLVRRVRSDNDKELIELKHDERYVRLLYSTIRQAIEARSNFLMQAKGYMFINALDNFRKISFAQLNDDEKVLSILNLEEAVTSIFIKKLPQTSPDLPEDFFDISPILKEDDKIEKEKNGKKKEVTKDGSCGNKTELVDDYDDIKYKILYIPDIDVMKKQWLDSIKQAKMNLWDIFLNWSIQQLNQTSQLFEESVNEIADLAEHSLNEQLNIIEHQDALKQQFWQDFEIKKDAVTLIYQNLQTMCKGENYDLLIIFT